MQKIREHLPTPRQVLLRIKPTPVFSFNVHFDHLLYSVIAYFLSDKTRTGGKPYKKRIREASETELLQLLLPTKTEAQRKKQSTPDHDSRPPPAPLPPAS